MNLLIFAGYYTRYGHFKDVSPTTGMLIFFSPVILVFLITLFYFLRWKEIKIQYLFKYFKQLRTEFKDILNTHFRFYQNLSTENKIAFEKRVNKFLINKKFIPVEMDEVTDEMKVMIAASCVQLTFGLGPVFLSRFKRVKVFANPIDWRKKFGKNREILIPWYEFKEGYALNDDGFNVGLEIMTIALAMEDKFGSKSGRVFEFESYRKWKQKSRMYAEAFIRKGVTKYHSYSEINKDEYFAVTVVYFFEKPEDFHNRFPELYNILVKLLNQNPLKLKRGGKGK